MNRMSLVARREWRERIRQRSFRVVTLINIVIILIAASLPTVISYFQDGATETTTVAVVDRAGIGALQQLAPLVEISATGDTIQLTEATFPADRAGEQIDQGSVDSVLIIERNKSGALEFRYLNDDGELDSTAQVIVSGLSALSFADRLVQAGVTSSQIEQASTAPIVAITSSSGATQDDGEIDGATLAVGFVLAIVMFMAIQLYGTWIAQGVVEEKQNRIMEIMINAATPRDLLVGKVLGIGMAALTQLVPLVLTGGLAFALQPRIGSALGVDTASVFGAIDFNSIGLRAIGGFLVYFVLGFVLYASLYAGVASMLSRQEDINAAISPLMIVMTIGYFAAFIVLPIPDSIFARIVSIFPLTSPYTMAGRLIATDVPAWELALSLGLLVLTMVVGLFTASRIYRIGVLMYGQKPSFKELIRNRKSLGGTAR
jgi:ABC-2 type transport system permease protein